MQRVHEGAEITTEIKEEYENSLVYKLKQCGLESISEIDISHSNLDEPSFN